MWAQMITTRLKPGKEGDLAKLTGPAEGNRTAGFRSRSFDGNQGRERPEPSHHVREL
jgi:hypothetical protein